MNDMVRRVFEILADCPPADRWHSEWEVGEAVWGHLRTAENRDGARLVIPPWPERGMPNYRLVGLPMRFSADPNQLALVPVAPG